QRLESLYLGQFALATEDIQNIGELPNLIELTLKYCGKSAEGLAEAYAAIGKQFPNLRKLYLTSKTGVETDILVMEGLAPCRNLRQVTLNCSWPRRVTSTAIQRLAPLWPQLEELAFDATNPSWGHSRTHIKILQDLALAWSETLDMISLGFDAGGKLPRPSAAVKGRFKKLNRIWVDYSNLPKNRIFPVAEFIASLCTKTPRMSAPDSEEIQDNWDAVEERVARIIHSRET
ncbi:hypothetical protein FRC01_014711, partial [Tulasnella sp. 417]